MIDKKQCSNCSAPLDNNLSDHEDRKVALCRKCVNHLLIKQREETVAEKPVSKNELN